MHKSVNKSIRVRIEEKRKQIATQTQLICQLIKLQNQNRAELEELLQEERTQKALTKHPCLDGTATVSVNGKEA
ncbi:hypothetical protein QNI19_11155 [Cytophagaceae bacterium DM2B3-1]|uniref:Uncharacterized protein n=1 Tax=Xanthocytophaga flava TaxID=3048013 RepID=A0ABT7CIZ2_9BACT|nr:hypothetical protein [Xanthocytophaga flavus]MDJ1493491.1 hypothetical protein [Xanthocytophaga flavus]